MAIKSARHLQLVTKLEHLPRPSAAVARLSYDAVSRHFQDLEFLTAQELEEIFTLTRYLAQRHRTHQARRHTP